MTATTEDLADLLAWADRQAERNRNYARRNQDNDAIFYRCSGEAMGFEAVAAKLAPLVEAGNMRPQLPGDGRTGGGVHPAPLPVVSYAPLTYSCPQGDMQMSEPKPYEVPDGHLIQLGADVLDGWEARWNHRGGWLPAGYCRHNYADTILVARRIPERTVSVELPESVVRAVAAMKLHDPVFEESNAVVGACRKALEVNA